MKVVLLEHTPNPDHLAVTAARQCYHAGFVGDCYPRRDNDYSKLLRKIIAMGHTSVLEHVSFTFAIEGISRSCSHQLVRFRTGVSFSQQSQRYVEFKDDECFPYVIPPTVTDKLGNNVYENLMLDIDAVYQKLIRMGVPAEDARFVLPNSANTNIVMTMNARELLHAMSLRLCVHSQWEIRELFGKIREIVKANAPVIFENCGPTCETDGICKEGERSCGKMRKV